MANIDISVIVPFYNEEKNLEVLNEELVKVLSRLSINSEVIYVNDGSSDRSLEILQKEVEKDKKDNVQIKIVTFTKNFGQTAAVVAGIDNSRGELISFLDADLQNDPQDIPRFLDKMKEGYDAVFGWRKERKDATLRSLLSKIANRIISFVFSYPYHDVGCSARVVKKEYLKNLQLYGELHRIMPVLIYLKGAKIGEIVVKHRERYEGKSKYGFERIVKTLIDIITVKFLSSYGTRPAYVFGTFGLGSLFISGLALIGSAYKKLFLGVFVHKDPLFLIAIFFGLVGIQFIMMGLLAELQVRTYFESQNKPIYEVRNIEKY
ncbi:MAG: Glycosyl transferase family 2 [Candidatus Woesebacteria bacterium GW2011_GWB1_39_12]|uniref:Glycosyl transferase family 2 n=2 Tax=Candidatus Woeseibacteriota TaxID=1752722 RepID=A0A0G0Q546_9BACT|nr:MAG: Glycosyl transferase family 2 [Candidatus Woesebacteria bacterium GW2011_GWA1_39_12]KKQ98818.1 MAG: Glycosyl transferase family 2 [Candidatus Woesebacteria bacterium GW2011_GWB1_39_12]